MKLIVPVCVLLLLTVSACNESRQFTSTVEPAFTVPQLGVKYHKFSVPAGATDVKIQGRFRASGGPGNDIEVALMNDDEFVNWQNHHTVTAIYSSEKVTQGTVNVSLPSDAGTYYLIFNNRFSLVSPKAVEDNLALQYTK